MAPRALEKIGPYELVRLLGRGGMAETYLACRRGAEGFVQYCCLKCVLPHLAEDASFRAQFVDEATLHGRLHHGNIVRVHDFGEDAGRYYLVMELVDGCDLAQLLEHKREVGRRLPSELAVLIAIDLCQALSHAHELAGESGPLGLVHRDLTPSNVLLTREGEVKLSDFGIARASQRRHRTQTGFTKGKFCYMSPEQIEARELDARSDLFALGVVMFEMLAGERPFEAADGHDVAVLPRILQGQRASLQQLAPELDPVLVRVVEALLATSPDERPSSAREVLAALAPLAPSVITRVDLARLVQGWQAQNAPTSRADSEQGTRTAVVSHTADTTPAHYAAETQPATSASEDHGAPVVEHGEHPPLEVTRTAQLASSRRPSILPSRGARAAAGVALAAAALVAGVWVGSRRGPQGDVPGVDPKSQSGTVANPEAPSRPEDPSVASPAVVEAEPTPLAERPQRQSDAVTTESAKSEPERAELKVVVVPFGNIWIDGKRRGSTRVRVSLPAGRHKIGIGRGSVPTEQHEVVLQGGPRTLEYRLAGTFE